MSERGGESRARTIADQALAWNELNARLVFDAPERLTDVSSWHTHIPFAFWCVEALRPRVLVELGTHKGDSYSAFCQAVKRMSLPSACYAVDTWKGDHEAGYYGDEVLDDLRAHHDPRYAAFSRLVRSTFDEALPHFADGSIDLLHIDGLHTYEAVRHDFESWRPKMSSRGVVLFHDVNVREFDFGAWRFWDEVRAGHPHFTFLHGHGLGVLLVGTDVAEPLRELAACPPELAAGPRAFFARLGAQVELAGLARHRSARLASAERAQAQLDADRLRLVEQLGAAQAEARVATEQVEEARRQLEVQRAGHERELRERLRSESMASARDLEAQRAEHEREVQRAEHEREAQRAEHEREVQRLRGEVDAARLEHARHLESWSSRVGAAVASAARAPARMGHALRVVLEMVGWAAQFRLGEGLRLRKHERLIRRSWLLDPDFYLRQCGEDRQARKNPIRHFLQRGARSGLDPNPFFDTSYYVEQHRQVEAYGKNPLIHFIRYGAASRLNPSLAFDTAYYMAHCPEARSSGLNPLSHYLVFGRQAGYPCIPPAGAEAPAALSMSLPSGPGLQVPPRDRVLVIDHRLPTPDQDSGSVRMSAIVELLRGQGHEVTFASDAEERMPKYEEEVGRSASLVLFGMEQVVEHLRQEGGSYRHALLSRPQAHRYMAAVRAYAPNAKLAYDTVDLHWVRLTRAADLTGDPVTRQWAERFRKLEGACATAADLVLAITQEEADALRQEVPSARVEVLPNIHSLRSSVPGPAMRRGLFFIGGFEHQPNIDAVRWFTQDVLPLVRRAVPDVVFHVVGSKPPGEVRSLACQGIDIAGYVPNPDQYFEGCRVFVSPLRYGAGMKGKIGQAMSYGLPVVTTSIGSEGMRLVNEEHVLVADDAASFAAAVLRVYDDDGLWTRLSENARRHLEGNFSTEAVRPLVARLFPTGTLGATPPGR